MAYVGKTYKHSKDENFKPFLESLALPADRVQAIVNTTPTQTLEKNGDEYTLTNIDSLGTKVLTFKNGVEFDEKVSDSMTAKTTFNVDGNVLTQVQKFPDGHSITLRREYSDTGLVVTLTNTRYDGSAKRYYNAA